MPTTNHSLVVAPSLSAGIDGRGKVRLTGKFVSGMQLYVDLWEGPVMVLIEPDPNEHSGNLDDGWYDLDKLPFEIVVARFDSKIAKHTMTNAGVVMGGPDFRMNHAAETCANAGVPFVMVTEYSLNTRLQIVGAENMAFWRRWRRRNWAKRQEKATVASIRIAAGLQCNGTPTFEAYRDLNSNALLYFDSRVSRDMIPPEPELVNRTLVFSAERPLRLAFSGRLNAMKGADHLVNVALALRDLGVPFRLDIFGEGPLNSSIAADIRLHQLDDAVMLAGVLDFATELMPRIRHEIDLFVCCHRQGDPSCTYLETLACGVPIVGYDNEAFTGLLRICPAGRAVSMDDSHGLAMEIARLASSPGELVALACAGVEFAKKHTFAAEFSARINHAKKLLELRNQ